MIITACVPRKHCSLFAPCASSQTVDSFVHNSSLMLLLRSKLFLLCIISTGSCRTPTAPTRTTTSLRPSAVVP